MTKQISINIWDDYYDDGYVPEGEIQETYAYAECDISDEQARHALNLLESTIKTVYNDKPPFEMELYYYESAKKYPHLVGTEHEHFLYNRWQLGFKNMTHTVREELVTILSQKNLSLEQTPFSIYSES